jgi:hypothetical protein
VDLPVGQTIKSPSKTFQLNNPDVAASSFDFRYADVHYLTGSSEPNSSPPIPMKADLFTYAYAAAHGSASTVTLDVYTVPVANVSAVPDSGVVANEYAEGSFDFWVTDLAGLPSLLLVGDHHVTGTFRVSGGPC